jgi:hypothetical protein
MPSLTLPIPPECDSVVLDCICACKIAIAFLEAPFAPEPSASNTALVMDAVIPDWRKALSYEDEGGVGEFLFNFWDQVFERVVLRVPARSIEAYRLVEVTRELHAFDGMAPVCCSALFAAALKVSL